MFKEDTSILVSSWGTIATCESFRGLYASRKFCIPVEFVLWIQAIFIVLLTIFLCVQNIIIIILPFAMTSHSHSAAHPSHDVWCSERCLWQAAFQKAQSMEGTGSREGKGKDTPLIHTTILPVLVQSCLQVLGVSWTSVESLPCCLAQDLLYFQFPSVSSVILSSCHFLRDHNKLLLLLVSGCLPLPSWLPQSAQGSRNWLWKS